MKRIIKVIAVLLCVTVLTGCMRIFKMLTEQNDARRDGLTTFDAIQYVRPDLDALEAQFEKTIAMHTDGSDVNVLLEELNTCWDMYLDFYTMDTVAEARSYLNMANSYYAGEAAYCLEAEATVDQLFEELEIASANHEKAETLEAEFWGDGLIDSYAGEDAAATYDDTYVSLVQEESALLSQYRAELANTTVNYGGRETSYQELLSDESLSEEELDEINAQYYDKYSQVLGEIYIKLVDVRQRTADYLGYDSYEEFAYLWLYGRDYTPAQGDELLEDIRTWIAPVYRQVNEAGLWDEVSYGEADENTIFKAVEDTAEQLGGQIAESFEYMDKHGLYDITISANKAEMSYQTYLDKYDSPYLLVKTYGYNDDMLTFAHEFGHFVDSYVNYNATSSLELSEFFSQSMEYLLLCTLPENRCGDLAEIKLLDTLDTYAQQASFAAFEQEVYAIPAAELTVDMLNEISLKNAVAYGYMADDMDDYYAQSWFEIPHFFEYPFYVISYCVSNDAAFQIYQLELENEGAGLEQFNALLPRDNAGFLDTLSQQSSLESPFAAGRMQKTAETVAELLSLN